MTHDTGRGDTRARIQSVALELFTEQGYERTSLREIAERLGVTKAALYYHFKSKDEIVDSLVDDQSEAIDELLEWAHGQPRTAGTRQEFVRRYAEVLHTAQHNQIMRFFDRNQAVLRDMKAGEKMRSRMTRLLDVVVDPDAPLTQQIKAGMALWALHASWFVVRDPDVSYEDLRTAAVDVALDMVSQEAEAPS